MKSMHPGFKEVAKNIAKKSNVSEESADKILASRSRSASPMTKKKNPRLRRVE